MASALVDHQIADLARSGAIQPFSPDRVNPASYNLGIGRTLLREQRFDPTITPWLDPGFLGARASSTCELQAIDL